MSSFAAAAAKVLALRASPPNPFGWQWQQTMLRIKDPAKSIPFYRDYFGMTLVAHVAFPKFKFDLYFMATLPEGTDVSSLNPKSAEAISALWTGKFGGGWLSGLVEYDRHWS
jgi:catechol 2,3-dioxygenase-like lactoylglutathione lyase family enzyme